MDLDRAAERPPDHASDRPSDRPSSAAGVGRRALLGAAGVAAAATAVPAAAEPRRVPWRSLARGLDGPLLRPGDDGYAARTRLFDPRWDSRRPAALVRARTADDVVETIRFARRHDLHVTARSGGHSYVGASTGGRGTVVVDLRGLDRVVYRGSDRHVLVGAGASSASVHTVLDRHGRTLPTGTCPTVGVAGLSLGGGLGAESRMDGLTCDRLVSAVVACGDGTVRRVSRGRHDDLFWLLRGGGGGNGGIVTGLELSTAPARPGELFTATWPAGSVVALVRGWQRRLRDLPDDVWCNVHLDLADGVVTGRVVGVAWDGRDARSQVDALARRVGRDPSDVSVERLDHAGVVARLAGPDGAERQSFVAGSDVLDDVLAPARATGLAEMLRTRAAAGRTASVILDPLDGAAARPSRPSAFPWRGASASVQWYVGLPDPTPAAVRDAYGFVRAGHRALGPASVGAYVNYLEPGRPVRDYYGGRVGAVRRVARRYDPDGVLRGRYSV